MSVGNAETVVYNDRIVRAFSWATVLWAAVGMLVGLVLASQLIDWHLNFKLSFLTFGRLRPLHTNAVIFAFAGNAIFAGIYYSAQRLLKTRMFSDSLGWFHFWGWQLIIVSAAVTLPLGFTSGKEYAELEWPIDIAITVVWVAFAVNFFGTLYRRRERHLYVAIWFYIASILTVAVLHIVNSLAIPVGLFKSYSIYPGAQDALIQWWYGHNAVAFFLTTPFLGLMYYFLPKAAERPVYSYRLSIIHFWGIVFLYIWAGPHHLLNTALPEWAQSLGMVFSVMLWMPSWGGMINGLLTLRGAWDKVRQEPVLKFMVAAVTFYGMATFEGPMMSIKSVNGLSHYTDWTIGHAHGGALGWNGFLAFGMLYWMMPRLYRVELFSKSLANLHFWLGTVGIVLYMVSMWISGVTQGLMLQNLQSDGRLLYPEFAQTLVAIKPYYVMRALGGLLYFTGVILGLYNLLKTAAGAKGDLADERVQAVVNMAEDTGAKWHRMLEGRSFQFSMVALVAALVGGGAEILPSLLIENNIPVVAGVRPYSPLELYGRDIYVREGCYNCHSQMIRPFKDEVARYGDYSRAGESIYDHPFQWGSKRTGPDLARAGGRYPDLWHFRHMQDPRQISESSIMPAYPWLLERELDVSAIKKRVAAMKTLGVPYTDVAGAEALFVAQAKEVGARLVEQGQVQGMEAKEIVALIAYLQRLGTDFKRAATQQAAK